MHRAPQRHRTYFITTTTANRRRLFQVESNALLLMDVLEEQRQRQRFQLHAFVIMPDHLHAIMTPSPEVSLEKAVQFIKGNFSHRYKSKLALWTPSFNETAVRDLEAFNTVREYIHQNPMRAGLTPTVEVFPFSSSGRNDLVDLPPEHLQSRG